MSVKNGEKIGLAILVFADLLSPTGVVGKFTSTRTIDTPSFPRLSFIMKTKGILQAKKEVCEVISAC